MASKSELLMKLVKSTGEAVKAECQVEIDSSDDLMAGFASDRFFQIEDFSLTVGLDDTESKPVRPEKAAAASAPKFAKWRAERTGDGVSTQYQLDVEPVSFSRLMDQGSTELFQACCQSKTFNSCTIIRRLPTGQNGGAKAYLRLDFTDVLITEIDWEDAEQIKEKYKFICRGVKMQFKPQASGGTLGPAIPGVWPKAK